MVSLYHTLEGQSETATAVATVLGRLLGEEGSRGGQRRTSLRKRSRETTTRRCGEWRTRSLQTLGVSMLNDVCPRRSQRTGGLSAEGG